jgi:hypothetical protein
MPGALTSFGAMGPAPIQSLGGMGPASMQASMQALGALGPASVQSLGPGMPLSAQHSLSMSQASLNDSLIGVILLPRILGPSFYLKWYPLSVSIGDLTLLFASCSELPHR